MATKILTPQQEAFCLAMVDPLTKNASDAYRKAYNCAAWKPATVNRRAFDMMEDGKILARIKELRDAAAAPVKLDLTSHLQRLDDLSHKAEEAEQYSAAISAEISRGKAAGLYTEKIEANVRSRVVDFGADDQDL